ncbi:D-mannose-1-phosphate guanyltransferase [Dysgonomonas sp. 520]|nr:D-mannose-1-phosphate guanyltransferase [Dysgonomonas sp. 520]
MKECIVLAGGFGTRLQNVVKDVPKCMAEVAGKPFLYYVIKYLEAQGFTHIVLSLGYKWEIVAEWLTTNEFGVKISYVVEDEPLGTGGAIGYAFQKTESENVFVLNGDTFFDVDTNSLLDFHLREKAEISVALKPMINFDRYGTVELDRHNRIRAFNEKQFCEKGLINGGIYLINKSVLTKYPLPRRFSFEKDILESHIGDTKIYGLIQDSYFIDIGIPEDYEKANSDFLKFDL